MSHANPTARVFERGDERAITTANRAATKEKRLLENATNVLLNTPTITPKFLLNKTAVATVLAASDDIIILKHESTRLLLTMPSIDWLELGVQLIGKPLPDTRFIVDQISSCRVMVSLLSCHHPRFGVMQGVAS